MSGDIVFKLYLAELMTSLRNMNILHKPEVKEVGMKAHRYTNSAGRSHLLTLHNHV